MKTAEWPQCTLCMTPCFENNIRFWIGTFFPRSFSYSSRSNWAWKARQTFPVWDDALLKLKSPRKWPKPALIIGDCAAAGVTVAGGDNSHRLVVSCFIWILSGLDPGGLQKLRRAQHAPWLIWSLSDQTPTLPPVAPFMSLIKRRVPPHRPVVRLVLMQRPAGFGVNKRWGGLLGGWWGLKHTGRSPHRC